LSWIAAHNRLATGDRVIKWNLQTDAQCVLCKPPMETREHLFFSCPLSQEIWLNLTGKFFFFFNLTGKFLGHFYSNDWSRVLEILMDEQRDRTDMFPLRYVFQVSIHTIRRETPQTTTILIKFIDKVVRNRISSLNRGVCRRFDKAMMVWFGSR
ncbi:unnamed protein product, partial [Brassica oleracea]